MFFFVFLEFIASDCQDYDLPTASKAIIDGLRELKSKRSMKLFGINSIAKVPEFSDMKQLQSIALPFLLGHFYTDLFVIIFGLIGFIFFLCCTILVGTYCIPFQRTKPKFFTTIIWWIFFSLVFGVSIAYFILSIIYTPGFVDGFPRIPSIIQSSIPNIISTVDQYFALFESKTIGSFTDHAVAYGAAAVVFSIDKNANNVFRVQQILDSAKKLSASIKEIEELPNDCAKTKIDLNINLDQFHTIYQSGLEELIKSINKANILTKSNLANVSSQIQNNLSSIFSPSSVLSWANAQMYLSDYGNPYVESVKKSFDTNTSYINICGKYLNIVLVVLLLIYYIFLTVTFCTQNSFSRCCVVSSFPISMIISVVIGILGVLSTSASGAIGDICADSSMFASQHLTSRPDFFKNINLPMLSNSLFDSPNNSLYKAINADYAIPISSIKEQVITDLENAPNLMFNSEANKIIEVPAALKSLLNNGENRKKYLKDLRNLYYSLNTYLGELKLNNCDKSLKTNVEGYISNIIQMISSVNNEINLQIFALESLRKFNSTSKKEFIQSITPAFTNLESFALSNDINTSSFCCPMRQTKEAFCEKTGAPFSCFAIFTHFYLISLVGFGGLLCCRRPGMLSHATKDENDDVPKSKKEKDSDDLEPTTNDVIRSISMPTEAKKRSNLSDSSDSSRTSSFSTFDMYQQSKTGVLI